jgi:hypothetical protein
MGLEFKIVIWSINLNHQSKIRNTIRQLRSPVLECLNVFEWLSQTGPGGQSGQELTLCLIQVWIFYYLNNYQQALTGRLVHCAYWIKKRIEIQFFFPLLLCWVGAHCDIYKGSYNISNISHLNSPPPQLPFISSSNSWNIFNTYHFCMYIHVYTSFALYSPSYLLSPPLPPPTGANPPSPHPGQNLFYSPVLRFCRRRKIKYKKKKHELLLVWDKGSYAGSSLVIFPYIYVLSPLIIYILP